MVFGLSLTARIMHTEDEVVFMIQSLEQMKAQHSLITVNAQKGLNTPHDTLHDTPPECILCYFAIKSACSISATTKRQRQSQID